MIFFNIDALKKKPFSVFEERFYNWADRSSPRRSQTSCLLPLRRLRSLNSTSCRVFPKKKAPTRLAFFRAAHSVSNPVGKFIFKIKKTFSFLKKAFLSWADRIRTCGMRAPKARVLPLDDGPMCL